MFVSHPENVTQKYANVELVEEVMVIEGVELVDEGKKRVEMNDELMNSSGKKDEEE